jgi:hypothetical protein
LYPSQICRVLILGRSDLGQWGKATTPVIDERISLTATMRLRSRRITFSCSMVRAWVLSLTSEINVAPSIFDATPRSSESEVDASMEEDVNLIDPDRIEVTQLEEQSTISPLIKHCRSPLNTSHSPTQNPSSPGKNRHRSENPSTLFSNTHHPDVERLAVSWPTEVEGLKETNTLLLAASTLWKDFLNGLEDTMQKLRDQNLDLQHHIKESDDRARDLEKDNDLLRGQISDMSSAQEPVHGEDWFVEQFTLLGGTIQSWVARETNESRTDQLSVAEKQALVGELEDCGEMGRNVVKMLGFQLDEMCQSRGGKILLIRHIVAVLLVEQILNRYCFGIPPKQCNIFERIEEDLWTHGSNSPA